MTLVRIVFVAVLMLFASSTAAFAQGDDGTRVGDWTIFKKQDNCSAISTFEGNATAWLGYYKDGDKLVLMILDNTAFAAVTDGKRYDGQLMFVNNSTDKQITTDWASLPINGAVLENGAHGIIIRGPADGMLKTFSDSEFFAVVSGSDVVISLKMKQGQDVIGTLRKCVSSL
ncbi:hypothetical protein OF829_01625 [Sphingomonas sp. LB-2]|uniref:hypothetical protein n=1 Tax=Sphingomonas caeni TaxID=2984949 RepID=UPI00222E3160|nr:hypothetical protein [Sphingomonas caeni]MCW3845923.1 hypothetical protein [Sphingomonas caeni]